jgi:uncharacterized membrane-anchored protein
MDHYAKVEGHPNLLRDLKSNAIINTDKIGLDNYTLIKKRKELEIQRIDKMESDLTELKSSIEEIKFLLKGIINES